MKRRSREYERLAAMAAEAKRRRLSYGQLMAGTTEYERNRSCRKGGKHKRKEVPRVFRYKKSIPVSYERQGYIYFTSLLYRELPEGAQRKILNLCLEAGGEYYQALFEFVTTDAGAQAVCLRHHLSPSVLERAVRRYYEAFPRKI